MKELYKEALAIQDGCNLSGIVHAWGRCVTKLWEIAHAEGHGTAWVNGHTVNYLYMDKLASLLHADFATFAVMERVYREAHNVIEEEVANVQ